VLSARWIVAPQWKTGRINLLKPSHAAFLRNLSMSLRFLRRLSDRRRLGRADQALLFPGQPESNLITEENQGLLSLDE